jgi:Flp pilus assembly pilin Flp
MSKSLRAHPDASATLKQFGADESGATAVVFCMLVSLISVAISATIFTLGGDIKTMLYDKIGTALASR